MPPHDARKSIADRARQVLAERGGARLAIFAPEEEAPVDPAPAQFAKARREIYAEPGVSVRFPYASLDAEVGRMVPGQLLFVMANTGQGKTTFLLDVMDRWAEAGVWIDYLGTEQEPNELITKWACLRTDVHPGVAIGKEWDDHAEGFAWQAKVDAEVERLAARFGDVVRFSDDKFINLRKIEQAAKDAEANGAHVLIVDHVDRIDVGDREPEYVALKKLIRRLKELARDHKLVMVVASQMNREARKADRLGAYRAPQLHQMQGGGTKEQEADVVLGLWRPIRQANEDETAEEYKKLLAAASKGHVPASDIIEANTMAVVLLKHRIHGERDGNRCKLHVKHGRITDIPERDKHSTTYDGQRRI